MKKLKIAVAVTGASGSIYAQVLLEKLKEMSSQIQEIGLVFSDNAKDVWEFELGDTELELEEN
jgi:4-hydroxy-3-polyprenylbenzoate decarboxylase